MILLMLHLVMGPFLSILMDQEPVAVRLSLLIGIWIESKLNLKDFLINVNTGTTTNTGNNDPKL